MTTFSLYDGSGADPLAQAVLAAGSGIIVPRSSAVYTGADSATSFADMTDLGAGVGVLLTSGTGAPPTHNTSGSYSVANYTAGAPELTAVAHAAFGGAGDSHDAAILSFDFEVSDPTATSITFKMLFGSDEYPEWSNTSYVDAAAVFVNGTNVALFDNDPTKPLSVIGANFPYIQDNTDGHIALEYDGISLPLSITAPAVKGLNHIEIAVSDTGDYIYDTGLLVYGMHAVSGGTTGVSNQVDGTGKNDDLDYSGSKLDQTFDLGGGDDSLKIGSGNNTVYAGDGNDSVYMPGGNAKNYIDGGDGYDTVYYSKASTGTTIVTNKDGTVTVGDPDILKNVEAIHFTDKTIIVADLFTPVTHLATTGYSAGTAGNDKVQIDVAGAIYNAGAGDDTVIGSAFGDRVNGGAGNDSLLGGASKDVLTGGAGADTVTGGGGNDSFVFNKGDLLVAATNADQMDTITDFHGAGGYKAYLGVEDDFITFSGFSAGAHIDFIGYDGANTSQIYAVTDGTGTLAGHIRINMVDGVTKLAAGDYQFA